MGFTVSRPNDDDDVAVGPHELDVPLEGREVRAAARS
jgi:hypothetical protein